MVSLSLNCLLASASLKRERDTGCKRTSHSSSGCTSRTSPDERGFTTCWTHSEVIRAIVLGDSPHALHEQSGQDSRRGSHCFSLPVHCFSRLYPFPIRRRFRMGLLLSAHPESSTSKSEHDECCAAESMGKYGAEYAGESRACEAMVGGQGGGNARVDGGGGGGGERANAPSPAHPPVPSCMPRVVPWHRCCCIPGPILCWTVSSVANRNRSIHLKHLLT